MRRRWAGCSARVLRLLAAEGMVSLGLLSLDGTKLVGNAAQKADRTLPQIEKMLAEAAAADAAEDAREDSTPQPATPRTLARRAERRERLAQARDRLAAEDKARRDAQRARQEAWDAAAAAGKRRGRRPGGEPRANRAGTEPRADITDPDVRVMRNQKGYVAGYNGQAIVTAEQVIVGTMLSRHPVDRSLLHPLPDTCRQQLAAAAPRRGMTAKGPVPGGHHPATSPEIATSHPCRIPGSPIWPLHEGFVRQADLYIAAVRGDARSCRR